MIEPSRILSTQMRIAKEMWHDMDPETSGPADRWLANYFFRRRKLLGSRDRRFLSEILYTLFRHYSLLEAWAEQFNIGTSDELMVVLAAAVDAQIPREVFMPEIARFGITSESAEKLYSHLQQKKPPAASTPRTPLEQLAVQFSFPLWLLERWQGIFGAALPELLEGLNERPPLSVRVNPIKITREELMGRFTEAGFHVKAAEKSPFGIIFSERVPVFQTEEFTEGLFEVQDEGSQLAGLLVDAKPGELIWDVCAGGGGKTLLMAGMMENKGRIVATDIRMKKLEDLKKRASRAGIFNIFPADLTRMDEMKAAKEGFDKILVDAPCSGSGTLRRNPDAKWKLDTEVFKKQHDEQVKIIESALPRLKTGGTLVYVTCSIDPSENEETITAILSKHPELTPVQPQMPYGKTEGSPFFKLYPHRDGTDGFFAAVLKKL
jgi:16S rRNA (cytosine967-C5)-methyltransferase